jgi:hypothetical protein
MKRNCRFAAFIKVVFVFAILLYLSCRSEASSGEQATFVVPKGFESTAGNEFAREIFSSSSDRFEQVYAASQFHAPYGMYITAISVRVDETETRSYDAVLPGLQIRLSTFAQPLSALSPFYELNRGSDEVLVFTGDIHLTGRSLGTGEPNPFDLRVPFSTPFPYNPAAGNLLMYFETTGGAFGSQSVDSHRFSDASVARQAWHDQFSSVVNSGLIIQFEAVIVPEPRSLVLITCGILGLFWRRAR